MTAFTIIYFAFLITASCAAAFYKYKSALLLLFTLLCVSLLAGLLGGSGVLVNIAIGFGLLAAAGGISYAFRESMVQILPGEGAKLMRTAPLTAAFGLLVIITYVIAAVFAPVIAPFGEAEVVGASFAPADDVMILGGDQLGRDMFSRLIYGARNTVGIAMMTTAIAFTIGTIAGLVAASAGGWVDQVLGRIVDTLMAIPQLIFALLLLTIVGTSVVNLTLVIALLYSPLIFRLARAVAGNIVVMDYIEAARLRGEKTWYIIAREVLPNITAPLAAEFGLRFCFVFLAISALSFLGLGIQPPTADWGSMVRENATLISFGEITPLIPAAAIALLTVAVNFVVDWMLHISSGLKE
ncbi:ABC transporter permease [Oceanibium sediminis]|uniref:ABC transporter permease n=1 Tax=Oceanibium sediminis TaxID=2026339 RepID=UPI000DD3D717|nr:ABC transporter permease [Oceanibium sediminis]